MEKLYTVVATVVVDYGALVNPGFATRARIENAEGTSVD
jgi:hypothetical protein